MEITDTGATFWAQDTGGTPGTLVEVRPSTEEVEVIHCGTVSIQVQITHLTQVRDRLVKGWRDSTWYPCDDRDCDGDLLVFFPYRPTQPAAT